MPVHIRAAARVLGWGSIVQGGRFVLRQDALAGIGRWQSEGRRAIHAAMIGIGP